MKRFSMKQARRRTLSLLCAAFLLTIALCANLHAAEKPPAQRPTALQIIRAAEALGSHERAKRVAAEALLKRAGPAALGALSEVAESPNRIAAARAVRIMDRSITGITDDTPPDVAALARSYAEAEHEERIKILEKLVAHGEHALSIIRALVMAAEEPAAMQEFAKNWRRRVSQLIRKGAFVEAEAWLWLGLTRSRLNNEGTANAARDLAAFLAMRGRDAQATHEVRGWDDFQKSDLRAKLLLHLFRVQGRYHEAAQAARRTKNVYRTFEMMAFDDDWAGAAALSIAHARKSEGSGARHFWKHAIACAYLAGEEKMLDSALAGLRGSFHIEAPDEDQEDEEEDDEDDDDDDDDDDKDTVEDRDNTMSTWLAIADRGGDIATPLLNRGRAVLAVNALLQHGRAAEIRKLDEAVQKSIVEDDPVARGRFNVGPRTEWQTQLSMAEFHIRRANDKEARAWLQQAFETANAQANSPAMLVSVAKKERAAGMPDLARKHFILALSRATSFRSRRSVLGSAVNTHPGEAYVWWRFFCQAHPDDAPAAILARMDRVASGALPAKEFATLAQTFLKALPGMVEEETREDIMIAHDRDGAPQPSEHAEGVYLAALAKTSVRFQNTALAIKCIEKVNGLTDNPRASGLRELINLLIDSGRWAEAVRVCERLEQMTEKPIAKDLLKHGLAKLGAGQKAEGKRLIEAAHLLPLANSHLRARVACELDWLGFPEEAAKARALLLQVADWKSPYSYSDDLKDVIDFMLDRMVDAGQWTQYRKLSGHCLSIIILNDMFRNPRMLVLYRNRVQVGRAGELLAAGKTAEAVKLAHQIVDETPCWPTLIITLVHMFDSAGMKAEADKLFEKSDAAFRATSKVLPGHWGILNDWAWTASECKRGLDAALVNAKKSALLTEGIEYWGTLAAVHIARKEFRKAYIIQLTDSGRHPDNSWQMGKIRAALKKTQK